MKSLLWALALISVLCLPNRSEADVLLNETFEAGSPPSGWTNTIISGAQGWSFRSAPAFPSVGGTRYAVFDDEALGAAVTPNQAALVSPSFNPTGRTAVFLRYTHHWFGVENTLGAVELSTDGGTSWSTIVEYTNVTQGSLGTPNTVVHDISAAVSGFTNVRVRFRYSDGGQAGRFWYLDNVQVYAVPDVGATSLVAPNYLSCATSAFSAAETVTIQVTNFGPDVLNVVNMPISVNVTGPIATLLNETWSGSIPALGTVNITLAGTVNMSAAGTYLFTMSTGLATDAFLANNSSTATRTPRIASFPFLEDFNANDGGWQVSSPSLALRRWDYGALPPTYAVDGPEGQGNSWRLYLDPASGSGGGGSEAPYLMSPDFDLTGITNPVLSFDIKGLVNNSGGWNQIRVEYSTNGGTSWTSLGDNNDPLWYSRYPGTNTGFGGFGGNNPLGNWTRVTRNLCVVANQPCVRFRFGVVWRNAGIAPIEFAMDNWRIENNTPDVLVSAILSPVNSAAAGCSYTGTTPVQVRVWNLRCAAIANVPVRVDATGPSASSLTSTVPNIPANSFVDFTFPGGVDLTGVGTYTLRAYTQQPGDADVTNDTATTTISVAVPTITTFPYSENFNASNGAWVGQGTAPTNQWVWGSVPAGYAGLAAPVNNAWRMVSTSGSTTVGLESPIFDLTRLNNPEMRMDLLLNVNTSGGWNTFRMEYSINGGTSWVVLPANDFYVAPILHPSGGSWGGTTSGNWVTVRSRSLCFLGNNTCVRFRISQGFLNAGVAPVHFAMDNFFLGDPQPYDVFVVNIQAPNVGNCTSPGSQPVTVVVQNDGCAPLRNVPVTVDITGPVTTTLSGTITSIPGLSRGLVTLTPNVDFSAPGLYTLTASFTMPADAPPGGDSNLANNTYSETRISGRVNTYPYFTDFNTNNANWAASPDNANVTWLYGALPPTYAVDGPEGQGNSWRLNIAAGSGSGSGSVEFPFLNSPVFDLTGITNPVLSFDIKALVNNSGGWNNIRVEYSTNGGTSWTSLGDNNDPLWYSRYPGTNTGFGGIGGLTPLGNWTRVTRNLCAVANQPCVRFRLGVVWRNAGIAPIEFAMDNWRIENRSANLAVTSVISPSATAGNRACTYRTAVPATIRVWNLTCGTQTNVPVELRVTGPIPATLNGTVPSIAANSFVDYTFPGTLDMSTVGTYTVRGYSQQPGDSDNSNDTATSTIDVLFRTISTFPYSENFNANNGGWVPTSNVASNSWTWGALPPTYAVDGPEGQGNSWRLVVPAGTGSGGGGPEAPWVTSPVFDLTGVTNPVLSFDIKGLMNNGGGWNQVVVARSTDGGQTWTIIGSNAEPEWYGRWPGNNVGWSAAGATGSLNDWTRVQRNLCEVAGQSCVQLRFAVVWRNSGLLPVEFAFDNIRLDATLLDASLETISGCFGSAYPLTVGIRNRQRCAAAPTITTANVTVSVNGALQTFNLTGLSIAPNTTQTVTLPGPTTIPNQAAQVRAWVKLPNGLTDQVEFNDSLTANLTTFPNCNDHCSNAIDLTIGTTTASQTTRATPNPAEDPAFSTCAGTVTIENTVWYRFQTNASGGEVTVDINGITSIPAANGIQVELSRMDAAPACDPANRTTLLCSNTGALGNIVYGPTTLDANATYYIAVDGYAGNDASFNITLTGEGLLPVEGLQLQGQWQRNEQDALLSWRTTRETNNAYFELQRSLDNTAFEAVAQVPGAGTTDTPRQYSHLDANLPADRYYYRLKQVDLDGTGHLSNTVLLTRQGASRGVIGLFPNPVRSGDDLLLQLDLPEDERLDIGIYDVLGKTLYRHTHKLGAGTRTLAISTAGLAQGSYVLRVNGRGPGSHRFQVLAR